MREKSSQIEREILLAHEHESHLAFLDMSSWIIASISKFFPHMSPMGSLDLPVPQLSDAVSKETVTLPQLFEKNMCISDLNFILANASLFKDLKV